MHIMLQTCFNISALKIIERENHTVCTFRSDKIVHIKRKRCDHKTMDRSSSSIILTRHIYVPCSRSPQKSTQKVLLVSLFSIRKGYWYQHPPFGQGPFVWVKMGWWNRFCGGPLAFSIHLCLVALKNLMTWHTKSPRGFLHSLFWNLSNFDTSYFV